MVGVKGQGGWQLGKEQRGRAGGADMLPLLSWIMDTWYVALLSFVGDGDDVVVHSLHNSA